MAPAAIACSRCGTPVPRERWNRAEPSPCLRCRAKLRADVFPAHFASLTVVTPERIVAEGDAGCFNRHLAPLGLSIAATLAGCLFGGIAVAADPDAKEAVLPFANLLGDPARRVAREESAVEDRLAGKKATFSAFLMQNNIRVSILALALGMTWGVGTLLLLFTNGVTLGAVAVDYVLAGQTKFLLGWLLPHGVIEIPAILLAGQAGFLLARALVGRGNRLPLTARLRRIGPDVMTLIAGVGLTLVWAGLVELALLAWLLFRAGTGEDAETSSEKEAHGC